MNQFQENYNPRHQQIFLLTLMGLLILRIPFFAGMYFFNVKWEWTDTVYQIGTYLLTTFLIWWELGNIADYHIDTIAVIIIILFKPIQTIILNYWGFKEHLLTFPSISSLIIWLVAIAFAISIWLRRSSLPSIKPNSLNWLLVGLLVGLATSIVLSYPWSYQVPADALPYRFLDNSILKEISSKFIYQIGYAAISEEPLFRGFLWGYLRKLKWREIWIWLFQAGLFTVAHIYYLTTEPILFWIIVPVDALVLGWIVWRSRTIASSMVTHGVMNAAQDAFGFWLASYRLG